MAKYINTEAFDQDPSERSLAYPPSPEDIAAEIETDLAAVHWLLPETAYDPNTDLVMDGELPESVYYRSFGTVGIKGVNINAPRASIHNN
jgi:hypothetical protein